jgi:hypothetical protein
MLIGLYKQTAPLAAAMLGLAFCFCCFLLVLADVTPHLFQMK